MSMTTIQMPLIPHKCLVLYRSIRGTTENSTVGLVQARSFTRVGLLREIGPSPRRKADYLLEVPEGAAVFPWLSQ